MGKAWEFITGRATNPDTTITAVTMNAGDSASIRNFAESDGAQMETVWATGATAGIARVRSPRFHDNVQGIRERYIAAGGRLLLPPLLNQRLYPQDTLLIDMSGGAAETDVMSLAVYYNNLGGADARLALWEEIAPRVVNILTIEVALTTGATVGQYGGEVNLVSTFDLLKADTDYAIIGYETSVAVHALGIRGPDTSNYRVGGIGTTERIETRDLFARMGRDTGRPHIPIIAAANRFNTLVDVVHTAAGTAVVATLQVAQLS